MLYHYGLVEESKDTNIDSDLLTQQELEELCDELTGFTTNDLEGITKEKITSAKFIGYEFKQTIIAKYEVSFEKNKNKTIVAVKKVNNKIVLE